MEDLSSSVPGPRVGQRRLDKTIAKWDHMAAHSSALIRQPGLQFSCAEEVYSVPAYTYLGPQGGGDTIVLALFAGIHGDEPEGTHALLRLVSWLEQRPSLAQGYCLFLYPICNPVGFERRTRSSGSGRDLNREFWIGSREPEVVYIENQLRMNRLNGIISLHTDDTSDGVYGYARGATLSRHLIEPALRAAETCLPRNRREVIDGFRASDGVIRSSYPGILRAPAGVRPSPFELILESPSKAPEYLKETALALAVASVLERYREFISYASAI